MPAIRLVRSKHPHRHHRRRRFDHREPDARPGRLQLAIARPRAFRKQDNGAAGQQPVENCSQSCRASAITIYRHHLPMAQDPAHYWKSEQILPRKVIDAAPHPRANQRWVHIAGVVRSQDYPSFDRHSFGIIDPPPKIELVERPESAPADEIGVIHGAGFARWALGFGLWTSTSLSSALCLLTSDWLLPFRHPLLDIRQNRGAGLLRGHLRVIDDLGP